MGMNFLMYHNLVVCLPEIFLSLATMLLLLLGLTQKPSCGYRLSKLAIAFLVVTIGLVVAQMDNEKVFTLHRMFVAGSFAFWSKFLILSASILYFIMLLGVKKYQTIFFEFPVIILFSIIGMMIMVSANDFLVFYMGLELQSLALYVLAAIDRDNSKSSEAGVKYFILGAVASCILLYGISLIYGFSGSTNFEFLHKAYMGKTIHDMPIAVLIGYVMVLGAIAFKIAAAPFHMWAPDVYEGSPMIVTSFFAVVSKIAPMVMMIQMVMFVFAGLHAYAAQVMLVLATFSLIFGSFAALRQNNIKRLLAYSSVAHVGYMLMALTLQDAIAVQAVLSYLLIYVVTIAGLFASLLAIRECNIQIENISDFAGLSSKRPALAAFITMLLLSLAGIPPFAGFFAKFYVFKAAIQADQMGVVFVAVISSVVSAYYYLKIIKTMYFDEAVIEFSLRANNKLLLLSACSSIFNFFYLIISEPIILICLAIAKNVV